MSDYSFLSSDRMVQQSVFENGVVATVNFGQKPFTMIDGYVLEAEGCRLEKRGEKKMIGQETTMNKICFL